MTRIVVLDGYTATPHRPGETAPPGEPVWDDFARLGQLVVHDRTDAADVVARAVGADAVLTNKTPLTAEVIGRLPEVRYIGVLATGTNVVDLAAAEAAGVTVTNVPAYSTASVAQHVFALLLELTNRVGDHDRAVHDGQWSASADFCFTVAPLRELAGLSLGIVGYGAIGRQVGAIGRALGMDVLVSSRSRPELPGGVAWRELDALFAEADVLTLHCPLTESTRGLVSAVRLATMKRSAMLINTGRGPLIDEPALAAALHEGRLAGAALDVLSVEPPASDNPLLTAPRCVITPHIAWATQAARRRLLATAAANLDGFLHGRPQNTVRPAAPRV